MDVPGYGYAKVSKTERAKWGQMLETYFTQRDTLRHVFLVVDFRHEPTEDDIQMKDFIEYYNLPLIRSSRPNAIKYHAGNGINIFIASSVESSER